MKYLYSFNSHSDFYNKHMVLEDDNVVLCKDTNINKWHGHYHHPPYDAEIEYLESTGTQWINTGYIMTSRNFKITIVVQWVGNDSSLFETFFGYMKADGINPRSGFHKYTGKWMFGTNTTYTTNTAADTNKHTFLLTGNASTNIESLYIDGVYNSQTTTASTGLTSNDLGMYLFARNRGTTIDNPAKIRIYSFHVVIYNEPAHTTIYGEYDFIPVRVGNVGYMYDKVSGQLFGNSGTGNFILGRDIKPIEYLQSTGTQYINTKLIHSVSNYEYYIDFTPSENENNTAIFGSSKSNYWDGQSWSTSNNLYIGSSALSGKGFGRQANVRETIRLIVNGNKIIGYKNGTKYLDTTFNGTIISGYQILLFAYTFGNNNASGLCKAKVHSFYIIMNNKKVFYGVPVRIGNVGYMYDKISGKLFANAGSGSFILGPDL